MVLFNDRNHFRPLGIKGAHWTCSGWSSRRAPWTAAPPLYWWRADQIPSRVSPCSALFQRASSLTSCSLTRRRQNSQVRVIAPSASASDVATTGRAGFSVAGETRLSLWHPPGMRLFLEDVHRQHVALLPHRFAAFASFTGCISKNVLTSARRASCRYLHGWKLYCLPIRPELSDCSWALMTVRRITCVTLCL